MEFQYEADYYHYHHDIILNNIVENEPLGTEDIDISDSYLASKKVLGDYVTLDYQHIENIYGIIDVIISYNQDITRRRPLNFLMYAKPGEGKSHFIKALVTSHKLKDICEDVVFNMVSYRSIEDFIHPLGAVRNIKVNDKLPVLFLDEIDINPNNYSSLLPILWDGEIVINGMLRKLGKSIIIMATSDRDLTRELAERRKSIKKIDDYLSRINGGIIDIPDLDAKSLKRNRKVDKVCIALNLIEKRYNYRIKKVPWNILKFIANTIFKFGVRSISHLVDNLPYPTDENELIRQGYCYEFLNNERLLNKSWFRYHIDDDQVKEAIDTWESFKGNKCSVIHLKE